MEFPFEFECRQSGNCCARPGGIVRVDDADVAAIAEHLGMVEAAVRSRFVEPRGDRLRSGLGGHCVFLEDGGSAACAIYPVRPAKCRSWPFWEELLESKERLTEAQRICPGIRPRG